MNIPLTICDYRSLDVDNDIHVTELRKPTIIVQATESRVTLKMPKSGTI